MYRRRRPTPEAHLAFVERLSPEDLATFEALLAQERKEGRKEGPLLNYRRLEMPRWRTPKERARLILSVLAGIVLGLLGYLLVYPWTVGWAEPPFTIQRHLVQLSLMAHFGVGLVGGVTTVLALIVGLVVVIRDAFFEPPH